LTHAEEVLAKLHGKLGKSKLGITDSLQRIPTPSIGLTRALGGGFGRGCNHLIWGNKSAGKSAFCYALMSQVQREGGVVSLFAAEGQGSLDKEWIAKWGVDTSQLISAKHPRFGDIVNDSAEQMQSGVDLIVIDSITAMIPSVFFDDKKKEIKLVEQMGQIGAAAAMMNTAFYKWAEANENTVLILISQIRTLTAARPTVKRRCSIQVRS
jgi:RecA/RadA recombinase